MLIAVVLASSLIPSFLISYLVVGRVRVIAHKIGLMDQPGHRKVHANPIPLGGGLGVWSGLVGTFALGILAVWVIQVTGLANSLPKTVSQHIPGLMDKMSEIGILLLGGTILTFIGFLDDARGLSWKIRLAAEFGVAALVVYFQGLQLTAFIELPWLTSLLSVFWIVALINSFNMLDNMDGLSGGIATICCTILALVLLTSPSQQSLQPQIFVASMVLVLAGSLLGFLRYNWPPAKIFMGDAGSYLVGYWIAIATLLTTYTHYQGTTPHAILVPFCVLAIPLYDMTSVIWIRLREGRSPFEGDKKHFSHRLVELGLSKKNAVLTIYLATATCGLGGLLLPRTDLVGAGIVIVMVGAVLAVIAVLESQANRTKTEG